MRLLSFLAALPLIALLAACASTPAPVASTNESAAAAPAGEATSPDEVFDPSAYRFGSGDKVRLIVYGEEELSGEFQIDGRGDVALPLIGTLEAKGLNARQMEKRIAAKLEEGYIVDPKVSVEVIGYRPFYILGEVRSPGSYPYVSGMTIINAVAMAGGYTYRGRTTSAVIKRAKTPNNEETVATGTAVFPGDVIVIKERYF